MRGFNASRWVSSDLRGGNGNNEPDNRTILSDETIWVHLTVRMPIVSPSILLHSAPLRSARYNGRANALTDLRYHNGPRAVRWSKSSGTPAAQFVVGVAGWGKESTRLCCAAVDPLHLSREVLVESLRIAPVLSDDYRSTSRTRSLGPAQQQSLL